MSDDYFYEKEEEGSPYYDTDKSEPLVLEENGMMSARAQDELIESLKRDNFEMKLKLYDEQKASASLKELVLNYETQLRELQLENERITKENAALKRTVSKLRSQSESMFHSPPSKNSYQSNQPPQMSLLDEDNIEKASRNSDTDMDKYFARSTELNEGALQHLNSSAAANERKSKKVVKHADFINEYEIPRSNALDRSPTHKKFSRSGEASEDQKQHSGRVFKSLISKIKHKK